VSPQAARAARIALDIVLVAAALLGAMKLFELGLQQLAGTAFWKTWAAQHSIVGRLIPTLAVAVACGLLAGLVLGGFAGARGLVLAFWAGSIVILVDLGGTFMTVGPKGWATLFALAPLGIAFGIYLGAVAGGKLMPSPAR
jgi:hypothetical protein